MPDAAQIYGRATSIGRAKVRQKRSKRGGRMCSTLNIKTGQE